MAKILIVYFSKSGNTKKLAEMIQTQVGGTMLELNEGKAPAVDLSSYDTIFVGTPNWSATMTAPVKDFLSTNNLSGKTVVPFCTHGMGGLQNVAADITSLCPNSTVTKSFAIKGVEVDSAPPKVKEWLADIKLI
jgi:flavodoxin